MKSDGTVVVAGALTRVIMNHIITTCLFTACALVSLELRAQSPGTLSSAAVTPTDVYGDTSLNSLELNQVKVTLNSNAGGAVWSWTYKGVEFVNRFDYGRLFQPAFFAYPSPPVRYNPTEGGAGSYESNSTRYEMGSAELYRSIDSTAGTLTTLTEPLEFLPENHGGSREGDAIYYDGFRFGKTITLNFGGHARVARFETVMYTPQGYTSNAHATIPAFFLRANYTGIYEWSQTYGAVLNSWPSIYSLDTDPATTNDSNNDLAHPTPRGGLIVTDPNPGSASYGYAIGFYMPQTSIGGSTTNFSWWNLSRGYGTGAESDDCYAIMPAVGYSFNGSQWLSYRVFVIVGESVGDVATEMSWLASNDYK